MAFLIASASASFLRFAASRSRAIAAALAANRPGASGPNLARSEPLAIAFGFAVSCRTPIRLFRGRPEERDPAPSARGDRKNGKPPPALVSRHTDGKTGSWAGGRSGRPPVKAT